ncbi:MAG: prepilin peptidase [Betaproteobacteria bacterium]|nr:prepilin peptidase [Betaproteobacteria bacterium]
MPPPVETGFIAPTPELLLNLSPPAWIVVAALLGLIIGSFLNVVIVRLPRILEARWQTDARAVLEDVQGNLQLGSSAPAAPTRPFNLAWPGSHCPACRAPIRPQHNVPLLSWLWLRGKCADCRAPISIRYPLVELLGSAAAALAIGHFGATTTGLAAAVLSFGLIALTMIDLETLLLPDELTLPLLWVGLLVNLDGRFAPLDEAVIGAVAGYLSLWVVYQGFRLTTGKEGMGYGDFKLLGSLGAWFGWSKLPALLLLASGVGAAVGLILIFSGRQGREVPIPFGPYLAGAGIAVLYVGEPLAQLTGFG